MSLLNSNIPMLVCRPPRGPVLNVTIELVQTANLRHYKQLLKNQCSQRSLCLAAVKENDTTMTTDHTRRGLLKVATLAGIGALLLPGTALLPAAKANAAKTSKPPAAVMVNGWLLNASDR